MTYTLAIHGGAGVIQTGGDEQPYHQGLRQALEVGQSILKAGGTAIDAVVAAVEALENHPLFNAGHGAVFTADESHELDAGVMDGSDLSAGAVAGARHIKNPVLAAHAMLKDSRYVLLCGEGADQFALEAGLPQVSNSYFSTLHRLHQLQTLRANDPSQVALDHSVATAATSKTDNEKKFGTVGAVALDQHGHLAAATSTGGMTNKRPGRIGDTPLIGAGVYANDASCAVSATGTGEHFIRACVGHDIHARMVYGKQSLSEAANATVFENLSAIGGEGGCITVGRDGSIAMPFNSRGMYRGWVTEDGEIETRIFSD
nr:isoaspartyl peptidase/L-asparaginase [uncultured Undibacterium sp.]